MGTRYHTRLFLFFVLLNGLSLYAFNIFLAWNEHRTCIRHVDFLHPYFNAFNLSYFIFPLTYLPLIFFLILSVKNIQRLTVFAIAYLLITLTRILVIYIFPLCEPEGAIRLEDELLNSFFYADGYCARDLMYSGHTATLLLIALLTPKPWKYLGHTLCGVLGIFLIVQKVHYTIDVLAAIPMAFFCYAAATRIYGRIARETYTAR